jgi:NADH-quinone oxidoreductase subunit A
MQQSLYSLFILFLLAAGTAGAIVSLSALIGRRRPPEGRRYNYECGLDPASEPGRRFPVKYFLTAMLFMIFDVEIVLLFPWAVAYRKAVADGDGLMVLGELLLFLALLGLALAYAWGRGALRWEE